MRKPYFLYVGNAYPHKNLNRLLQALSSLISQYPKIFLVLVGKEDYFYEKLKEKVRKMGLVNNVTFYGEAKDEELHSLYRNAKALVLPSLMEGFGLPALEAMANKCLVLASDIAVLAETCGKAAIYFNPYDVEDITEKIKDVIQSDSLTYQSRISDGIKRVRMFSWRRMAEQTVKVYESL